MFSLIMAGGMGTRFWPASRESLPKQFLKIFGNRTMIEETVSRVSALSSGTDVYVVVNEKHEELARQQLAEFRPNILAEPFGRNTAACIALAALHIKRRGEDIPIIVLPADHYIANEKRFLASLSIAGELAASGAIVSLGIMATRPETGYGYLKIGPDPEVEKFFRLERFVEKPDQATACEYIADGSYLWNSGIFAFTAKTILSELQIHLPDLFCHLEEIDKAIDTSDYQSVLKRIYPEIESISIDYGVMEKTNSPVYVLQTDFGWSDVGSWQSLYELQCQSQDRNGNLSVGTTVALESKNNFLYSEAGRTISVLGVEGLIVVDTKDTVLVTRMDRSQDLGKVIDGLKQAGLTDLC